MKRYEYKVIDTGKHVEQQLNELGAQGWQVVGVTTKKQLFIAPPQAIILMREMQTSDAAHESAAWYGERERACNAHEPRRETPPVFGNSKPRATRRLKMAETRRIGTKRLAASATPSHFTSIEFDGQDRRRRVDGSASSNTALRWVLDEARLRGRCPLEAVHGFVLPQVSTTSQALHLNRNGVHFLPRGGRRGQL